MHSTSISPVMYLSWPCLRAGGAILQGAELMSKFGINVPPGQAAQSLADVQKAAEAMKDENNEVRHSSRRCLCCQGTGEGVNPVAG